MNSVSEKQFLHLRSGVKSDHKHVMAMAPDFSSVGVLISVYKCALKCNDQLLVARPPPAASFQDGDMCPLRNVVSLLPSDEF